MTWPRIAVPAYIHPQAYAGDWDALLAVDPARVPLVVANVADGPGDGRDEGWADVLARARRSGAAWQAAVRRDVDAWYHHYGDDVGGVFFDRVHGTRDSAPAYRRLGYDVKRRHPRAVTALNPGGVVPSDFEGAADVVVTFEGTLDRYRGSGPTAGELDWSPADPAATWHLVYDVAPDHVDEVLARSQGRGAGLVYLTDQSVPNPWGRLASYWDRLVTRVEPTSTTMNRPGDPRHPA